MRISLTYLYTIFRYGYPPALADDFKVLPEIRRLGFRFVEMEGLGKRKLIALYRQRERFRSAVEDHGLHVHNFCIVDPDMVSLDPARRKAAYERFKFGTEIAEVLGAETLHLASSAPPVRYLTDRPYELGTEEGYKFAGVQRIRIPNGFDWDAVWDALVESCRFAADVAARTGRIVLMEPRVGETICSVDSLLRLIEHVGRPNFKANLDTGHFSAQRENVALAVAKLRGKFANVHLSDNNPRNSEHVPLGDGVIDWREFFRVLRDTGYDGYLGLDLGLGKSLVAGYRRSVDLILEIASELKIPIEM